MTSTRLVPLGDVASLQSGVGFPLELQGRSSGDYPLAKVGDISRVGRSGRTTLFSADHYVDEEDLVRLKTKPIPAGSVLFSKIGEAIRQNHRVVAGCPLLLDNNAMAAIPNHLVESKFLFHYLRTVDFYSLASATTVPALRKSELEQLKVPLPQLDEQRRIAAILDMADALRRKRKRALDLLDSVTQSIFLEMFGNPRMNSKAWKINALGNVADFFSGNSLPNGENFRGQRDGYLLLKVSDLNAKGNSETIDAASSWSPTPGSKAGTCNRPAVLFPKRGGAIATNKKRKLIRPAILDPNLMAVAPEATLLTLDYLFAFFRFFRLEEISSGSTVPQLNKQDLAPLKIATPPFSLQRKFSTICEAIGERLEIALLAAAKSDLLFTSLQSQAFSGQL